MTRALAPVVGLAAAAVLAGCGGGDDRQARSAAADTRPGPAATDATPRIAPNPATVKVLRGWTDELRHGHVKAASRYFSVPTIVQNNTPPLQLRSRAAVEYFNRTLPCGAYFVRAEVMGIYTIGVFRLTERPGEGECGSGSGHEAAVAFIVEHDHITQWRRLMEVPPKDAPQKKRPAVASGPAV
jgi:hypothetical protein